MARVRATRSPLARVAYAPNAHPQSPRRHESPPNADRPQPRLSTSGVIDSSLLLDLQRTIGNQAVMRVIAHGRPPSVLIPSRPAAANPPWLQRLPRGGSATAMLDDLDGYEEEDETDNEAIDDDAAEYLVTGDRPQPKIWDFVPESFKAEEKERRLQAHVDRGKKHGTLAELAALRQKKGSVQSKVRGLENQQTYGRFGDKATFQSFTRQQKLAEERQLTALSLASPGSAKAAAAAIDKERAERIEAERLRIEAQRKAEEEEARRIAEEAAREEAERKAKEQQEKALIQAELQSRLRTTATGGVVIDGWAKIQPAKQTELIEDTWKNAVPSDKEISSFLLLKKKSLKGSAAERERKAKEHLPAFLAERRAAAITETVKIAQGLVNTAILAEKQANLAADRQVLLQAIQARGAAGDVLDLLTRAISEIKLSAGTDATIEKGFRLAVIRDACSHWKQLARTNMNGGRVSDQLSIVGDIWSPGDADDIYWKDRGQNWERTKNLMVKVGNATVNIHIRSGRWQWPKKRGNPPNTD